MSPVHVSWTIERLRAAAPELAAVITAAEPRRAPNAELDVDTLEAAMFQLRGPVFNFALKLLERLRAQRAAPSMEALLQGMTTAAPALMRVPALAWERGVAPQSSTIGMGETVQKVRVLADGALLTIRPYYATLWDAAGTRCSTFELEGNACDGLRLAEGVLIPHSGQLELFGPEGGRTIAEPGGSAIRTAMFADGRFITNAHGGGLIVWSPDGARLHDIDVPGGVSAMAVTTSARIIAASAAGPTAHMFTVTGERVGMLEGHTETIRSVDAWPDGGIVTGSNDHTARIWSPAGGCVRVLPHDGPVTQVIALPKDRVLTVANGAATVWDARGNQVAHLADGPHAIDGAALLPDGRVYTHALLPSTGVIWSPRA